MISRTSGSNLCRLCTFVAVGMFTVGDVNAQPNDRAGEVAEIAKSGFQYHAGSVDFLDRGDAVVRNARLETDMVGEMALTMDDGSQLVMPPSTEIEIDRFVYDPDRSTGQAVIALGRGALRMISGRMRSDSYLVTTPVATIGLRGTDFTAELVPGAGLIVRVDEGAVVIRPYESADQVTVIAGQVKICSAAVCRDANAGDPPLRRARLGPVIASPAPQTLTASVTATRPREPSECPPFHIPGSSYRQIGLDPANWPGIVEGITFYRHSAQGTTETLFCPERVDIAGSNSSFVVRGRAVGEDRAGETKILYYVNVYPGLDLFEAGHDHAAKEAADAEAYRAFMPRVFADHPGVKVETSDADLRHAGSRHFVLHQTVLAQGRHGRYRVTGYTLYRPVAGGRTALFGIPAVVTPDPSEDSATAIDIARALVQQLGEAVVLDRGGRPRSR